MQMASSIRELLQAQKKEKKRLRNICISIDAKTEMELRKIAEEECCGFATLVRSITKKYLTKQKGCL